MHVVVPRFMNGILVNFWNVPTCTFFRSFYRNISLTLDADLDFTSNVRAVIMQSIFATVFNVVVFYKQCQILLHVMGVLLMTGTFVAIIAFIVDLICRSMINHWSLCLAECKSII